MTRKSIPDATQLAILAKRRRRCCLCYWVDDRKEERPGQIAHLDQDHENFAEDNLAWLCVEHHDRYDSTTSQTKGFRESEVRHYRDCLYEVFASASSPVAPTPAAQQDSSIARYTEDRLFDIVWRWKWRDPLTENAKPVNIEAYCPDCDIELSFHEKVFNFGPGANQSAEWYCTECEREWPGYSEDEVAKRIMKKKRSGEWNSLVK